MENDQIWNLIAKKLAGEASPEELLELEKALRVDPDLHYSLQAIHDLWISRPKSQHDLAEKAFEKHLDRLRDSGHFQHETPLEHPELIPTKTNRWIRPAAVWAAFLLIFGGIFFAITPHPKASATELARLHKRPGEIVTQNGSRTKLLLPDGTSVWLNADSRLTYDSAYGNQVREVSLTGEGFFDVVKNKEKPFIIHTGNINIKVLGTAFNVKSYPEDKTIETTLIRGRIEVTMKNEPSRKVILHPNQKLIVQNADYKENPKNSPFPQKIPEPVIALNPLSHFGPDSLVVETAWVQNKLVFEDESFIEVAKKMERWYGMRIELDDKTLDTLHFTGSFENESIQQALKALQLSSNFNYMIHGGEAHILKPTKPKISQ